MPTSSDQENFFIDRGEEFVAKRIETHCLKIEGKPGFDSVAYLAAESTSHYLEPGSWLMPSWHELGAPPRTRIFPRPDENLLDTGSRLTFFSAEACTPGFGNNGLFASIKSQSKDRLILDARPENLRQIPTGLHLRSVASAASSTVSRCRELGLDATFLWENCELPTVSAWRASAKVGLSP